MADLPSEDVGNIQLEETIFDAAVSEYTAQREGKLLNFLRAAAVKDNRFTMNGYYRVFDGQTGVDGIFVFPYDSFITDFIQTVEIIGSGSQNNIDLKYSAKWDGSSFGAFASILTQTSIATPSAPANTSFGVGDAVTGTTAPVFTSYPFPVNKGDRVRIDGLTMMSGDGLNATAIVRYIPRGTL